MTETSPLETKTETPVFDLGTFEAFNFRTQSAVFPNLTAAEVINWDHDRKGEAEFWPSGDRPEVALLFQGQSAVSATELSQLEALLSDLGGDSLENFLLIHFAVNLRGQDWETLTAEAVEDDPPHLFFGSSFLDVRREAAWELFELYYPEAYQVYEHNTCDGLLFDEDRFLDSPSFLVEEVRVGEGVALLVSPQ